MSESQYPQGFRRYKCTQITHTTSGRPQSKEPSGAPASPNEALAGQATASPLAVLETPTAHPGRVLGASTEPYIVERIIETAPAISIVSPADLAALESRINLRIEHLVSPPPFPQAIGGSGNGGSYAAPPPVGSQAINQLNNVTINNPTIIGGSLSGTSGAGGGGIGDNATTTTFFASVGHFTTGVIDALTATAATIANLGTTELVATNSTTTNLYVSGTARIGSGTGVLQSTSGVVSSIANGTNGQVLKISGGVPTWGTDLTGSGGGSSAWATTTDSLAVYTTDPTQVVLVGTNATTTTGNILEVKGNTLLRGNQTTQGAVTASSFTATSSATSTLGGGLSAVNFSQTGSATSTGTNGWNIAAGCYAIGNQCLSFSTLTGLLSLTSQVAGTLPVANGGTGSTTLSGILKGNGTSQVATAIVGTDYEFPLTFNSPLSRVGNAISLSTSGDWSGTLGGFTAAQLVAAGFSTTSADAWKNTRNFYSTTSADYWLTQKTTDNLAEGSTNKYWSNTLFDNRLSATSSLPNITTLANLSLPATQLTNFGTPFFQFFSATTTSALAEGNNLYFTSARADARINATSTIGTLTSAPSLGTVATSLTGFLKATAGVLSTALINLASDITGILPVGNGGTGWASLASGAIPFGNGSSALATTSAGTPGQILALLNGVPTWTATTTLSTISGTLAAGGGGTGIPNPSAAGLLLGSYAGGSWQQLATSSLNLNSDNLVEGSSNLFWTNTRFDNRLSATTTLPAITTLANLASVGTLSAGFIGSGFGGINIGGNALTAGAGTLASISVSGASQFANSSNFFGLTSFGATGTTTIATNGTISTPSITANSTAAYQASFGATATSTFSSSGALSLAGGLTLSGNPNGPLHANNGIVGATTSIGVLYGGTGLTSAPSYGTLLLGQSNGTYALTATSSLGLPTFSDLGSYALISQLFGKTFELGTNVFGQSMLAATTTLNLHISGTGTSTFAGGLEAWRHIAAPYFTATSSTASSTFAGNVQVDGQLKVGTGSIYLNGNSTSTFSAGIQTSALNVTSSTASSTFSNGIALSAGCFSVNGTCVGSGSSGSGGGQLLAVYATSTPGANVSVNFNGASGSAPSFSGGVLTLPSNTSYFVVETWGGGGGGGGSASNGSGGGGGGGSAGGASSFGNGTGSGLATSTANGGSGGSQAYDGTSGYSVPGGTAGSAGTGDVALKGSDGDPGGVVYTTQNLYDAGGSGGAAPRGGGGGKGGYINVTGSAGGAFGGGGGGGGANAFGGGNGGGGSGSYARKLITSPSGTYYYNVGAGGAGGPVNTSNSTSGGGNGGAGGLVIEIYTTGISNGSLASGTAGQFAFWNAAGTNLSATSSLFVDTTTSRIGVGTTSNALSAQLAVAGTAFIGNGTTASSTFNNNLEVLGALKVGTGSIYLNGSATSTFSSGLQTAALNITSSTATSTFANGIQLSGGCVLVNGSCLGSGSGSVGSGTQGQFAFYNAAGTALAATSTLFLAQNMNLGVGTSTPNAKFTVFGDIFAEGSNRYLNFGTVQGTSGYGFRDYAGTLEFKNSGGTWQGVTTATSGPSFSVNNNGSNITVTADTFTKLNWSTEAFDTNNNFDLSSGRDFSKQRERRTASPPPDTEESRRQMPLNCAARQPRGLRYS